MIVPSKFIPLKDSVIGKLSYLFVGRGQINVRELYDAVSEVFDGVDQFLYALDVLYVLNRIDIDFEKGLIVYAD
jgi:hypothetical protein